MNVNIKYCPGAWGQRVRRGAHSTVRTNYRSAMKSIYETTPANNSHTTLLCVRIDFHRMNDRGVFEPVVVQV